MHYLQTCSPQYTTLHIYLKSFYFVIIIFIEFFSLFNYMKTLLGCSANAHVNVIHIFTFACILQFTRVCRLHHRIHDY